MNGLVGAIITGITTFAATNIDDIIILMLFFAQINETFRRRHIILGQYLGFIAIILASLPGFFGGLVVPKAWIGLLGFVPIAIGISYLVNRKTEDVQIVSNELNLNRAKDKTDKGAARVILSPQTYSVAAVTFANGGDNIGIYVPIFANIELSSLITILSVFFLLVGVWCYIADRLSRQQKIANILTRRGQAFVPFVLIGLGIFILVESGSYYLIPLF